MLRPRITPCLLIHDGGLVKTVHFKEPKYVGDPINAVKVFNEKEADELIVLDIDATRNSLEPNYKKIAYLAAECRMPLCYGGGVKTAQQAKKIVSLGVEKVAVSTAFMRNPDLIGEMASEIGRQSVVVVLDVKKRLFGFHYDVWVNNGTENTKRDVFDVVVEAQEKGAGEIVINSMDNDGMMKGYDIELAQKIQDVTSVPLTFLGGAGGVEDIKALIKACGVVGAAAGSLFVFKGAYKAVLINYPDFLRKNELLNSLGCFNEI